MYSPLVSMASAQRLHIEPNSKLNEAVKTDIMWHGGYIQACLLRRAKSILDRLLNIL